VNFLSIDGIFVKAGITQPNDIAGQAFISEAGLYIG